MPGKEKEVYHEHFFWLLIEFEVLIHSPVQILWEISILFWWLLFILILKSILREFNSSINSKTVINLNKGYLILSFKYHYTLKVLNCSKICNKIGNKKICMRIRYTQWSQSQEVQLLVFYYMITIRIRFSNIMVSKCITFSPKFASLFEESVSKQLFLKLKISQL